LLYLWKYTRRVVSLGIDCGVLAVILFVLIET